MSALALFSCSDESLLNDIDSDTSTVQTSDASITRDVDEVLSIANFASKLIGKDKVSTSRASSLDIKCITAPSKSRTQSDTLLYVVNYGDDNGFAIISAKKDHDGLLAVTDNGSYIVGEEFDNPGMNMMLRNAISYASLPLDPIIPPAPENPKMMEWVLDTLSIDVAPRLTTAWGKDYLGEYGMPDDHVTCGPIAVAQALSYLKQPSSIVLTYKDNSLLPLDWDAMIADKFTTVNYQRNLLGPEIAYRLGAFTSPGNSTNIIDCKNLIDELAQGHTTNIYNSNASLSTIKNSGIVIVSGQSATASTNQNEYAHTFIIDGGHQLLITETTYIVTYLAGTKLVISREFKGTEILRDEYYFHINWGWSGINNGYFNSNLLAPHRGIEYDDRISTTGYGGIYQYDQWYFTVK